MVSIFWFRRDLRLGDHPALLEALSGSQRTYLVATADILGTKFQSLSDVRRNSLRASWAALAKDCGGKLEVLEDPNSLVSLAKSVRANTVHCSAAFDTNGRKELLSVEKDLAQFGIKLVVGPGNYAVQPGSVLKGDGTPYKVYTPFYNEWSKYDVGLPFPKPELGPVSRVEGFENTFDPQLHLSAGVLAGEDFAAHTLKRFLNSRVVGYDENRNRPDLGGTSHLSHALSHGEIHPRTVLQNLPVGKGAEVFRKEIAWREFYADVLWSYPESLTEYLDPKFARMRYDFDPVKFDAWCQGRTGYPMVDAGMRQLSSEGWMHNRVRMIVASFLVKDLHIEWQHGAEWFEKHLTDFDPASNSHGWQWTAGCGTDASPFFRVFNPVGQGLKFDPDGVYVRKYIPELSHLSGTSAHEPWDNEHGYSNGYPKQIVDHAIERAEALARLAELKSL
jgi:deoxyribodipyrimidine photo-lyase